MRIHAGWQDQSIALLLNELGSRSMQGYRWYGELVCYYRNRYGRTAAA